MSIRPRKRTIVWLDFVSMKPFSILFLSTLLTSMAHSAPANQNNSAFRVDEIRPQFEPIDDVAGLPRVLLIGDSISIGYTFPVRRILQGKANLHRIPENGGPTARGVEAINAWLGEGTWDVIHFNFGLHDIKIMPEGNRQVSEEDYEANLKILVARLQRTGASLIWCTTTPVPAGDLSPERRVEDVPVYNAIALGIMEREGIVIDDLHGFALPRLDELLVKSLSNKISELLGERLLCNRRVSRIVKSGDHGRMRRYQ